MQQKDGDMYEECEFSAVKAHILPAVQLLMDLGMVDAVDSMLAGHREAFETSKYPEVPDFLEQANGWLRMAKQHEDVHGAGSMLNKDHPTYVALFVTRTLGRPFPEQFRDPLRPRAHA